MAFSVSCPSCGAILKSPAPIPAGKKVKCPKCGTAFEAPAEASEEETAVRARADDLPPPRRGQAEQDEEEAPARRRREDAEDAEDAEDDPREERSVRKPKKRGMGVGMMIGVVAAGGLLLFVACAGCAGLSYFAYVTFGRSPIIGTWEPTGANPLGLKATFTFDADGKGRVSIGPIQVHFKYRMNGNVLEMESEGLVQNPFGIVNNRPARFNVQFHNNNEMTLTNLDGIGRPERFRRVGN